MTNMEYIAELTDNLPELSDFEIAAGGPVVALKDASGDKQIAGFGYGVYKDEEIGMMRAFMLKGSSISLHRHEGSHEWIGVIKGKLEITIMDSESDDLDKCQKKIVGPYGAIYIAPNVPHYATALEDSWMWAVSIPPAAGYPDVSVCPFAKKVPLVLK